jgi:hypothetical protein
MILELVLSRKSQGIHTVTAKLCKITPFYGTTFIVRKIKTELRTCSSKRRFRKFSSHYELCKTNNSYCTIMLELVNHSAYSVYGRLDVLGNGPIPTSRKRTMFNVIALFKNKWSTSGTNLSRVSTARLFRLQQVKKKTFSVYILQRQQNIMYNTKQKIFSCLK